MSNQSEAKGNTASGNNWASVETWQVRKPALSSTTGGLVVSHHYAASETGANVLADGGNAVDAAVATSLMIGTVEPWMSGLGGGGFMLYYEAATQTTHSIEFGMRAPWSIDPADYPLTNGLDSDLFGWPSVLENRNVEGPLSIATPGYLAGIANALEHFGSRPFAELITPAVESAGRGMPIDWYATLKIAAAAPILSKFAESARTYLSKGFVPAGEWGGPLPQIKLGRLADTLSTLKLQGPGDFYQGDIAASLCADANALGSRLDEKDLSRYTAITGKADQHQYRDTTVYAAPGMSAGPTLRDTLTRLEKQWRPGSAPDADTFCAYANALQAAYDYRLANLGDIDDSASPGCTTHLTTVDSQGNMVALTQTLLSVFGSRVMFPGTGVLMNNGMMWFDPRPGRPNSMAPGKRPLSNMCPAVFRTANGNLYATGASGGRRIMPAVMQLLSFVSDFNMSIEEAMHHGRIDVSGAPVVCVDQQLGAPVAARLEQQQHNVIPVQNGVYPVLMACPNLVCHSRDGENSGAAFITSPWAAVAVQPS